MSIMQSGVVEVKLTRGLVTIIDAEDFEFVSQWKWCAIRGHSTDYVSRRHGKTSVTLHRVLLNAPAGVHVDHRNSNGLDNRRENIRLCTPAENRRNSQKSKGGSSEFKGVSKYPPGRTKTWFASIRFDKKRYARYFATELEAALWYDEMAKELHGEFAKLNFP